MLSLQLGCNSSFFLFFLSFRQLQVCSRIKTFVGAPFFRILDINQNLDEEWNVCDKLFFLKELVHSWGHNEPIGGVADCCGTNPLVVEIVQVELVAMA